VDPLESWVAEVSAVLGLADIEPQRHVRLLLDLARDAAHAIERPAAPVTTYLLGLAAGRAADPATATTELAEQVRGLIARRAPAE